MKKLNGASQKTGKIENGQGGRLSRNIAISIENLESIRLVAIRYYVLTIRCQGNKSGSLRQQVSHAGRISVCSELLMDSCNIQHATGPSSL